MAPDRLSCQTMETTKLGSAIALAKANPSKVLRTPSECMEPAAAKRARSEDRPLTLAALAGPMPFRVEHDDVIARPDWS
jgi:hypothetical protein